MRVVVRMIFLKLNSPWDTVSSHLTQGLYVGGPHDVVFRSELDFESERGAVTWGEIRTVLAHQGGERGAAEAAQGPEGRVLCLRRREARWHQDVPDPAYAA